MLLFLCFIVNLICVDSALKAQTRENREWIFTFPFQCSQFPFLHSPISSLNLIPISIRFPLGYSHFQPIPTCAHSKTIKCKFKQSTGEQQKNTSTENWTADDVSHKPGGRLPLLSARPAVTLATLKWAANNFAAWLTEAQWVWTVCPRQFPDSVAAAMWTRALLRLSPAR